MTISGHTKTQTPLDGTLMISNTIQYFSIQNSCLEFRNFFYKRSWLKHRTTSWKVAVLIPKGVIGIFHWHNSSSRTMALGSSQPLTEMSTRNISWGKGSPYVGLITLYVATVLKSGSLKHLKPSGPVQASNGIALPLPVLCYACLQSFMCISRTLQVLVTIMHTV